MRKKQKEVFGRGMNDRRSARVPVHLKGFCSVTGSRVRWPLSGEGSSPCHHSLREPPRGAHLGFRLSAVLASPGEEPGRVITQHSGLIWTYRFEGDVAVFH